MIKKNTIENVVIGAKNTNSGLSILQSILTLKGYILMRWSC